MSPQPCCKEMFSFSDDEVNAKHVKKKKRVLTKRFLRTPFCDCSIYNVNAKFIQARDMYNRCNKNMTLV